jgi:hypothetical protein
MMPSDTLRRETAGALLVTHLAACARAVADGDDELPELDLDPWQGPDDVALAVATVTALLGHRPDDKRKQGRVLRMFQALAELIADQGAQLECDMTLVIHGERRHAIVCAVVDDDEDLPTC